MKTTPGTQTIVNNMWPGYNDHRNTVSSRRNIDKRRFNEIFSERENVISEKLNVHGRPLAKEKNLIVQVICKILLTYCKNVLFNNIKVKYVYHKCKLEVYGLNNNLIR